MSRKVLIAAGDVSGCGGVVSERWFVEEIYAIGRLMRRVRPVECAVPGRGVVGAAEGVREGG